MNPKLIVQWLRDHATKLNEAADKIEVLFGSLHSNGAADIFTDLKANPSAQHIKRLMAGQSMRLKTIAERLHIKDTSAINSVVTEANGFVQGRQGWWSVANDGGGNSPQKQQG